MMLLMTSRIMSEKSERAKEKGKVSRAVFISQRERKAFFVGFGLSLFYVNEAERVRVST